MTISSTLFKILMSGFRKEIQEVFHVYLNNYLKIPLLVYFSLYLVIIDFHGLV